MTPASLAARLHGPRDLRLEHLPPASPGPTEVRVRIATVGICGSDLHMYETGRIGDSLVRSPLVLGHEFGGTVIAAGREAIGGDGEPLVPGQRVAIDPAVPCRRCRQCDEGHPNLCPNHRFYGVPPDDGAMRGEMVVEARNCFPVPADLSDASIALLETLGVAIHAVDLGHLRVADSVAVIGCGPVGLLIVRLAHLAGAHPIHAVDIHPWRVAKARQLGATSTWTVADGPPRGLSSTVDVVFEAAWADHSIQQAAELARFGGRVVLVGIPNDDRLALTHSTARRKGLSLVLSRRMKHTYQRAIRLVSTGAVNLDDLVSHRFPLTGAAEAFETNLRYPEGLLKAVVQVSGD
ncbi:MAG TPA: alcohol dehydrogenase catalytic domain-containing protein [Vicinamibacterales bacterium]